MYINDTPESIQSNIRLFADDTSMCIASSNQSDYQSLQKDLTKLETWEQEWLMAANPDRCEIIRVTKKRKPTIFDYKLHGSILKSTQTTKYLGVNISDDLLWSTQITRYQLKVIMLESALNVTPRPKTENARNQLTKVGRKTLRN